MDRIDAFLSGRTLATTTTTYRYENGRTYHAYRDGEYWQPNDEKQNNHEAIVYVLLHHKRGWILILTR